MTIFFLGVIVFVVAFIYDIRKYISSRNETAEIPDDLNPDEVRHLEALRRKEERGRPFKILANFIGVVFLILTIMGFGFVALMITIMYEG